MGGPPGPAHRGRLTGAEVHAVTAWEVPVTVFFVLSYTDSGYARDARETLDKTVAEVIGPDPGVPPAPPGQ